MQTKLVPTNVVCFSTYWNTFTSYASPLAILFAVIEFDDVIEYTCSVMQVNKQRLKIVNYASSAAYILFQRGFIANIEFKVFQVSPNHE